MKENLEEEIAKARVFAKSFLENEGSGHDWWHCLRVAKTAGRIAEKENASKDLCILAALLHDVGDHKLHGNDPEKGDAFLKNWLHENLKPALAERIFGIISEVSFKGAGQQSPVSSIESAVVQDADRLDAIGAIGIARTFAYGGSKSRLIYHPDIQPENHPDFKSYRNSQAPTINHFYEKLLLLKDRMQTKSGKQMAMERHQFMEDYLQQFYKEWDDCREIPDE